MGDVMWAKINGAGGEASAPALFTGALIAG